MNPFVGYISADRLHEDFHLIAKAFERMGLAAESIASDVRKLRELTETVVSEARAEAAERDAKT